MKILTIICNVVLLGIAFIGLLTRGNSSEPLNPVLAFLLLSVPVFDIIFMLGSRVSYSLRPFYLKTKISQEQPEAGKTFATYMLVKIIAVILNLVLAGFLYRTLEYKYPASWSFIEALFALFVILTPVLSVITILLSRANKFREMKRSLVYAVSILGAMLFCFILGMRIWIGQGIKERINIAKQEYPGKAEDALIAYLSDSTHTPHERSNVAISTLGQIRSQKALPILKGMYKNDPEGKTCKYHHNTVLCQYEIHKAIVSIEHKWLGAKEKNWFGSWARLNK